MSNLKGKIGLEIHAYILTNEKLFCRCLASRERGLIANTNICPICTGQPGSKPMLPNGSAVEKAIMIGLMLNCKINERVIWKRKHYDWPDLPKGYQNTISGHNALPLGIEGNYEGIGITEMHLEEDPASWNPETGEIDYNRSGLPLVEIVTEPDFVNSKEVVNWLNGLIHNLAYLKIVDSNAGIKVDVNVNIPGKTERVEIKNISSIESIGNAIDYELVRQGNEGQEKKETRRFDSVKNKTIKMRSKEEAEDYRFISDPDLVPMNFNAVFINSIKDKIPESPKFKLEKLIKNYNIDKKNAEILSRDIDIADFFESVANKIDGKFALPWITIELMRVLNYNKTVLREVDINVEHFVKLLELVKKEKITELQAKQILNKFYPKSFMPEVKEKISDEKEIEKLIRIVIEKNKKAIEDYKNGDKSSLNYLMGEVMKLSDKRADFMVVRKVLTDILG